MECVCTTAFKLLSLEYAIGFYRLVLIVVTYRLINLHERNVRPVVWLWSPFKRCLVHARREWNIRSSIIEAFATFLMLSYFRFLSISFKILLPAQVFDIHGDYCLYLYSNASIEYFGEEHLPYAIMAILVLLVFNVLPLLLLLLYIPTSVLPEVPQSLQAAIPCSNDIHGCLSRSLHGWY